MSYIEREALLKNAHTYSMEFGEYLGEDVRDVDVILTDRVKEAPAADVAPVVHGHWEVIQSESCVDGAGRPLHHIICSRCGQYWSMPEQAKTFKRCFACGAIMDGGEKHEAD